MEILARKYLLNQCSAKEAKQVLYWFDTLEGKAFLQKQLDQEAENVQDSVLLIPEEHVESQRMYFKIKAEIAGRNRSETASPYAAKYNWQGWFRAVAMICLILGSYLLYENLFNQNIRIETTYGETRSVTLPDRSVVTLNGNSVLTYDKNWENEMREVWLDGEAYFSVTHTINDDKFLVYTGDHLKVEVLGTEFTVNSREGKSRIVLNRGKVRVNVENQREAQAIIMAPGELVEYDAEPRKLHKDSVNPEVYSSWKNKKLIFDNTSIGEIIERLENTYGLEVVVSDPSLLEERFTGSVPNDNMDILLDGLSGLFDLEIIRKEGDIHLKRIKQ